MPEETNYLKEAISDALDTISKFKEEIVEQLERDGEASTDLYNDYSNGDSYHHERHTDRAYSLIEAAHVLDQLGDYEETDGGMWDGLAPREAISVMAAYTYSNAVMGKFQDLVRELNDDFEGELAGDRPRGPKEWSPRRTRTQESTLKWADAWIKKEREKLVRA